MSCDIISIATILSPIISCVAIIVALYIGNKNSLDIKNQIEAANKNTEKEIKTIKDVTRSELEEIRKLTLTLMDKVAYDLDLKNCEISENTNALNQKFQELCDRFETIKNWHLESFDNIDVDDINNHFDEMKQLYLEMERLLSEYRSMDSQANTISKTYDKLLNRKKEFCNNRN